jgi:trk system potassium uptake protein TrkH
MLLPAFYGLMSDDASAYSFIWTSLITLLVSVFVFYLTRNHKKGIQKREGYLIVALSWLIVGLVSSFPYYLDTGASFTDSFFESVSGLTTTGASIFNDVESLAPSILIWRSLTQWIGGMGIIVLTIAIFPILGIGGVELFVAESPGPTNNKIHPRIKETAKIFWMIYVGLTLLLTMLLYFEGMPSFDAFNHALTTIATGGFSIKNSSIAFYNSAVIESTIMLFMFIAGINYTLLYFLLSRRPGKVWKSDEFRFYTTFVLFMIIVFSVSIVNLNDYSWIDSFRYSSFQVISLITTTGFATNDYMTWNPFLIFLCFSLLFAGASAGSTSGGIKFIRHLVFAKNSILEFKRLLHPNALIRLKIDGQIVAPRILTHILVFLLLYLITFIFGSVVMAFVLADTSEPLVNAMGLVATSLGNVGPALNDFGPSNTFALIPDFGKIFLCFIMLTGRLEIFSILILLTPYFWRNH